MFLGSLIFFLISATVGTRVLLGQFTPGFHEYEAIFLYASDVLLLLFLILSSSDLIRGSRFFKTWIRPRENGDQVGNDRRSSISNYSITQLLITVFLLFAFLSIFFAPLKLLALYQFIRLLAVVAMAFAIARVAKNKRTFQIILGTIAMLAVVQSGIGIAQFIHQKAVGLSWLGESPISPTDGASSKILVSNSRVLRAYGLFPHPNILATFLVLGLFALIYFYLKADKELYGKLFDIKKGMGENFKRFIRSKFLYIRVILAVGIFTTLLGLILTFSRSAWLATAVSLLFLIVSLLISRRVSIRSLLRLLFLLFAICTLLFAILHPFILPRTAALNQTNQSVTYRLAYNKLGLGLIKNHPLGIGLGNQIFYSVKNNLYQNLGMKESWQWQPIHNIYLLMASEIGILGLVSFLLFILTLFFIRNSSFEFRISITILLALLLIGLFDHFLWTIWQGRIMLWLVIGLVLAQIQVTND